MGLYTRDLPYLRSQGQGICQVPLILQPETIADRKRTQKTSARRFKTSLKAPQRLASKARLKHQPWYRHHRHRIPRIDHCPHLKLKNRQHGPPPHPHPAIIHHALSLQQAQIRHPNLHLRDLSQWYHQGLLVSIGVYQDGM